MRLSKRECGIEMKLVPYGAGWTDVYFNIWEDNLYFVISSAIGAPFSRLLEALYYLYPTQNDPVSGDWLVDYCNGICKNINGEYKVVKIVEDIEDCPAVIREIPYKAEFCWDEEGASSSWVLTREPKEDADFDIKIDICINRTEKKYYSYKVRYKEFCYAVAKTCTEVLKSHGIYGYHHSTYSDDINIRQLLFIKAVALDCIEIRKLKNNGQGMGESTSFEDEMTLLLFDM